MAFCQNCGVPLNEGTKFCPNCGTLVQTWEEPAAVPAQQEVNPVAAAAPAAEPMQVTSVPVAVMEKETVSPVVPQEPSAPQPESQQAPYQQPAPQQAAYQQPAPQQAAYQQSTPQQAAYQQPAPQQAPYQQPVPLQAAYQQPAPQPTAYQPFAPQQGGYQQPAPQQNGYQQAAQATGLSENQMKKGMAILSYFGFLVLIPIFAAKKDPFARYHANQGLVLCIVVMICSVLSNVLTRVLLEISPLLVLIVSGFFGILTLVFCIFSIIGIIHAAKGQKKPLPLIGGIKILK